MITTNVFQDLNIVNHHAVIPSDSLVYHYLQFYRKFSDVTINATVTPSGNLTFPLADNSIDAIDVALFNGNGDGTEVTSFIDFINQMVTTFG